MPDELSDGHSAVGFGVPQGGAAAVVEELSVRLARESAAADAESDRSCRTEHHPEHYPGPGERHHSAQGDAEAEGEACVLSDEHACCPQSSQLQSSEPEVLGAQLGVGVGLQQRLHARLVPLASGFH